MIGVLRGICVGVLESSKLLFDVCYVLVNLPPSLAAVVLANVKVESERCRERRQNGRLRRSALGW